MKTWIKQYRVKGDNKILSEVVDVHFTNKREVQKWWKSKSKTFIDCVGSKICGGYRDDKEFINCKPKQR
jgi:predicted transcriptional regulator of viral defense system